MYRATEINPPRPVALMVLPSALGDGPAVARFKDEARMAMALNHPNIVPIYRVGLRAGVPYFVASKLVAGRSLDAVIESQGALPLPAIVLVLRATVAALVYAHGRGTIHGDLKAATILVDPDGRVMVSDFGIARAVGEATPAAPGKPRFSSPELAAAGAVGPSSDQYALGIVTLEMLMGSVPSRADPLECVSYVRSARDGLPDALLRIVQTVLAPDPAQRFASAAGMFAAVNAIPFSDVDRREAYALLGQLARGAPVPKVRVALPPPHPEVRMAGATAPRTASGSAPGASTEPRTPAVAVPATRTEPPAPAVATPAASTEPRTPAVAVPTTRTEPPAPAVAAPAARTEPRRPAVAVPATRTEPPAPAVAAPTARTEPHRPAVAVPAARTAPPPRAKPARPAAWIERAEHLGLDEAEPEPERRARAVWVLAALLVVAGLAGAWYVLAGRHPAAVPTGQAAVASRAPTPPAASAAVAESARADTAHQGPSATSGTRSDTALGARGTGVLLFYAVPATADIVVDDEVSGNGGFVDSEVTAGRRHLEISAPGYETLDTLVTVRAGATLDLGRLSLRPTAVAQVAPATGRLALRTDPPTAEIFVDGESVGVGVLAAVEVAAGQRRLRIIAPGYQMLDTLITVEAGVTVSLGHVALRSAPGGP